jgi:hypothetical protein
MDLRPLDLNETAEDRAAIEEQAKALAATMREADIAAYAVRAQRRIEHLEAMLLAMRAAQAAKASKTPRQLAIEARDACAAAIAATPQTGDRLHVARDRLAGIIEILPT